MIFIKCHFYFKQIIEQVMGLILWQEAAKLAPFFLSQYNFWKFGIIHGTFNITLPNWRVKVRNKIAMNELFRYSFRTLQKKTNLKIFIYTFIFKTVLSDLCADVLRIGTPECSTHNHDRRHATKKNLVWTSFVLSRRLSSYLKRKFSTRSRSICIRTYILHQVVKDAIGQFN